MTVDQLRAALVAVPGHLEVVVRASDDDDDTSICCGVFHAGVDHSHNEHDTPFFAIDASTDVDPEPSCAGCGFTREGCVQAVGCDFGEVPR